jgi:aminomethyltransferase
LKKTPLYENHLACGGKIIDFGGWALPVEYLGIIKEHESVRTAAGLFDVSHMGEILIEGSDAGTLIQSLVTNDISSAFDGRIIYSPMCYEDGGVVDDLLIYRFSFTRFLLVVNAANVEKDYQWIRKHLKGQVTAENLSESYAQLALQGPLSQQILQRLTNFNLDDIKFYHFAPEVEICGVKCIVSRTGYTGEDGFEIYADSENAALLWERLLEAGLDDGLVPVGLGARDTLRFEAALPLYGHELSKDISPLEAGLSKFVKFKKPEFIGREPLFTQHEEGTKRKLIGFEITGRGIARNGYEVFCGSEKVGYVTTGSYSPTLKKNIGMALINSDCNPKNSEIEIKIRDRQVMARLVTLPFYIKKYKK